MNRKPNIIVLCGPTAVGKTTIAIEIAKHFKTEIINADSRQIYKELNIAVAKPSALELAQVKHHFINHCSIHDNFTAADFRKQALEIIDNFDGENIVLSGGTGLYIDALLFGLDPMPKANEDIRHALNNLLQNKGIAALQNKLIELDPKRYAQINISNPRHLIRSLEITISSGKTFEQISSQHQKKMLKHQLIVINRPREELYERINKRVDLMVKNSLLEESKALLKHKLLKPLNTVGYKEMFCYLSGEYDFETAVKKIKQNTRRYAKRQLTWLRRYENAQWVAPNIDEILKIIQSSSRNNRPN